MKRFSPRPAGIGRTSITLMRRPVAGIRLCVVAAALLLIAAPVRAQTNQLDPSEAAWEFTGDTRAGIVDGASALLMRTGTARRPDVTFASGIIEFEYRGTDERSFLGVVFRAAEDGTAEDIYLRLHKSKQPDAVQYTPDLEGRGQWQLWHGPDATAYATFHSDEWVPVRIEVAGGRATASVGTVEEPQLVAGSLASGRDAGFIGFWANQPGAGPEAPLTAAIRNIRITHRDAGSRDTRQAIEAVPGAIRAWGISAAFARTGDDVEDIPSDVVSGTWTAATARPDGLLPLEPHAERPDGPGVPAVLAALAIDSDRARTARLDLGFSDDASVFLNGRLLYSGRHSFSTNFPRRQGLITLDQAAIRLPLESGENVLVVAVSDAFGGWGVMGRVADRAGLRISPWTGP